MVIQQFLVISTGDGGQGRLQVSGTSSGVYGSFGNSVTLSAKNTTYFDLITKNAENNFGREDRTITFTNNGVSNTDLDINTNYK